MEKRNTLDDAVQGVAASVVAWRRHLHAHPELSNRERATARFVGDRLMEMGLKPQAIRTGLAGHGVVAMIEGDESGPTIALRADMDALPVQEATGLPFASQTPHVMHACGHDAHTAMLLGAARVLLAMRDQIRGRIKLIFQGAEEGMPEGEPGGASLMVAEGVLEDPPVAAIFGMHVTPHLPAGKIAYCRGAALAAVDRFTVRLIGRQAHGALPHEAIDPVVAAAQVISALQTIAGRSIDPRDTVVVTVGNLQTPEGRWNIIPGTVVFEGTARTHRLAVGDAVARRFEEIVRHTAAASGVEAAIDYQRLNPPVKNDRALVDAMLPALRAVVGDANLVETTPWMAGEDFAHYSVQRPGLYIFLGAADEQSPASGPLHSPSMRIDEAALPIGVKTFARVAMEFFE